MLRLLNLIMIICAAQAWGQSSGFAGAVDPRPAPRIAPAVTVQPRGQAPAALVSFPRCPNRSTNRADLVQKMIEQFLNIESPWDNTLASDRNNSFTLQQNRNELQVLAKVDGTPHLVAASMCLDTDGLRVKLVATGFLGIQQTNYIKVRPMNAHQVHITSYEDGQENPRKAGIFTSQARR